MENKDAVQTPGAVGDSMGLKGHVTLELVDENGMVKQLIEQDNLIVQVGKNYLAGAILASATSPWTHMAVGTNGTAATTSDTTLGTEVARVAFNSASTTTNVSTVTAIFGAGVGTGSLQEAGLFTAASVGTMLSHVIYTTIAKAAGDTLTITWAITAG